MTRDELAMLEFAITWAPFGGGDEHILPQFGILPTVFYRRLQRLLARHTGVNSSVRRRLNELCTLKLDTLQAHHSVGQGLRQAPLRAAASGHRRL